MTDSRAVRILYRVLCMAVKLIETEYGLRGKPEQPVCVGCTPSETIVFVERVK